MIARIFVLALSVAVATYFVVVDHALAAALWGACVGLDIARVANAWRRR